MSTAYSTTRISKEQDRASAVELWRWRSGGQCRTWQSKGKCTRRNLQKKKARQNGVRSFVSDRDEMAKL